MNTYNDGLNYVPLLSSTPVQQQRKGRRRTLSQSNHSSNMSLTLASCYNGNYEGDKTMFSNKTTNRRVLSDTDSDSEYKKDLDKYQQSSAKSYTLTKKASQPLLRLWLHYKQCVLSEERQKRLIAFVERLRRNFFFQKLYYLLQLFLKLLLIILRWILICLIIFGNWSYGLWRSKSFMRNTARRLLWKMTLAKCGDIYFFSLILVATPVLFVVSICGFCLSVYCTLKDNLSRSKSFIRSRGL